MNSLVLSLLLLAGSTKVQVEKTTQPPPLPKVVGLLVEVDSIESVEPNWNGKGATVYFDSGRVFHSIDSWQHLKKMLLIRHDGFTTLYGYWKVPKNTIRFNKR